MNKHIEIPVCKGQLLAVYYYLIEILKNQSQNTGNVDSYSKSTITHGSFYCFKTFQTSFFHHRLSYLVCALTSSSCCPNILNKEA